MGRKKEKMKQIEALAEENRMESIATDPFGMYTGNPENPYETPVQDVDDI